MKNRGAKPRIVDTRTEVEKLAEQYRARAANEQANEPLVPVEAQRHGDYVPLAETGVSRKAMVNRGGTPIARWDKLLSDTQKAAIAHCVRLWEAVGSSKGLSANLDRVVFGVSGDGMRQQEALDDLHRIKGYFRQPLDRYWSCFESVCRDDEPAGVAGSRLERASSQREHAARLCVMFVADVIYTNERLTY